MRKLRSRDCHRCRARLPRSGLLLAALLALLPSANARAGQAAAAQNTAMGEEVLKQLLSTPLGKALPGLRWSVQGNDSRTLNASLRGGQITVTGGLADVMGNRRGVWAAALAHEMGHAVILDVPQLPIFQAALGRAYRDALGPHSDPREEALLIIRPAAGGFGNLKGARQNEFEADRVGAMLMAEAGYHPDFAIVLDRLMRWYLRDEPRLSAFLVSHPLWTSREERLMQIRSAALEIYRARWPDPSRSPGGPPPAIGGLGAIEIRSGPNRGVVLRVPLHLRNGEGKQIRVAAVFFERWARPPGQRYVVPQGQVIAQQIVPAAASISSQAELRCPVGRFPPGTKRLRAVVYLLAGDETVDVAVLKPFDVPSGW